MTSDMPVSLAIGLLLMVMSKSCLADNATVQLSPHTEYVYKYTAFSHLKDTALVKVTSEVCLKYPLHQCFLLLSLNISY